MRILVQLTLTALTLVSCSNSGNSQLQKSLKSIAYDTITINIKGTLEQAIKFKDKYYCFFAEDKPYTSSRELTFYKISDNGKSQKRIFVPDEMQQSYLDLHIRNDSILSKDYYDHRTYFFDMINDAWKEVKKADDRVFEDDNFYVTFLDFGEFGGTLWFKNKSTGIEYEIASSTPVINQLDGKYYVTTAKKVIEIENPLMLNKVSPDSTYEVTEKKQWSMGSGSAYGAKVIFIDSSYDEERKFYIATSFVINNRLKFLCVDNNEVYIANIENGKTLNQDTILKNSWVYKMHNTYRQNLNQLPDQLLQFSSTDSKSFGFIEINKSSIKVHFIHNLDTVPMLGTRKADIAFISLFDFLTQNIGNLSLKQVDSLELMLKAYDATPRHKMSLGKETYPNKENYNLESPQVYKMIEDSTLTLITNFYYTKPDMSVKVFICEWESTHENAYRIYVKEDKTYIKKSYQNRFNVIDSVILNRYGNPTKTEKGRYGQYFYWQTNDNLTIVLFYSNSDQYRNIQLKIYKD